MNPYTLTLLRHGDIEHDGRLIGLTDLPLTELGHQQLARSWQRISNLAPVTSIASSPLQRCREFAVKQALSGSLTLKVDPRFAEMDFGHWDGQPLAELEQTHPGWGGELAEGRLSPPGGESFEQFRTRVLAGLADWMTEARGSHRLLVTHGGVITVLMAELFGTEFAVAKLMTVQRGGFVQLSMLEGHPPYLLRLESSCAD
ncbi:histidine phosphatase family protein [Chromobacterium sp. ATCC 53434]|uniref:histidine phosphatase family protein n=1 Tax=Chromobacterium TaxID=535 RepID=UPI000C77AFDC|nr:histidine phosphatase family protein [Chromobacterium sp. ATCC 53434]AUH53306.1 histidine phosphatase family protein [Chromobacterium sp. ATCC 53434]